MRCQFLNIKGDHHENITTASTVTSSSSPLTTPEKSTSQNGFDNIIREIEEQETATTTNGISDVDLDASPSMNDLSAESNSTEMDLNGDLDPGKLVNDSSVEELVDDVSMDAVKVRKRNPKKNEEN